MQKSVDLDPNETIDTLYARFLYPEGIEAMLEAVNLIEQGQAPKLVQSEEGATYDPMLNKPELTRLNLDELTGQQVHNWVRGCDKVPGAWIKIGGQAVKLYGSKIWNKKSLPTGESIQIDGKFSCQNDSSFTKISLPDCQSTAILHSEGLLVKGKDGVAVNFTKLGLESGKMILASKFGAQDQSSDLGELSAEEKDLIQQIRTIWESILNFAVEDDTDFFKSGAGSMDVTRLVEAVIELDSCADKLELTNEDVYMATTFDEFTQQVIIKLRNGGSDKPKLEFTPFVVEANKLTLKFPTQLFINNQFIDSSNPGKVLKTINPADETVICDVQCATAEDVDKAVQAAQTAFESGEWANMNARDRGRLLYKLADLMEQNKRELATLESIDSGAVYTLAMKTHVGMSIDTWRYFAGWCDKIQGDTIPINNARPNKNLTITRKEPIGVCGIITPWNYPLMMVSWKMAACLAAGNTVVLKPAQVSI